MPVLTYEQWRVEHPAVAIYTPQHVALDEFPTTEFEDDRYRFGDQATMVGFHIWGRCPACGHLTRALCATKYLAQDSSPTERVSPPAPPSSGRVNVPDRVQPPSYAPPPYAPPLPAPAPTPTPTPTVELLENPTQVAMSMKCACVHAHEKSPGGFGCGAGWLLQITYSTTNAAQPVRKEPIREEVAVRIWPAVEAAGAAVPTSFNTAQASATKWQGALTAFVALIGIAAVLGGRDTIQGLENWWEALLVVALIVAVGCNAAMLYRSDLASIGFPALRPALTEPKLEDDDLAPLLQATKSVAGLRSAFFWMLGAVAASIVVVGIFVFAPSDRPASPAATYKVTEVVNGVTLTTPCGTFTPSLPIDGRPIPSSVRFKPNVAGGQLTGLGQIIMIETC